MAMFLVMRVEACINILQAFPVCSLSAGKTEKLIELSLTQKTPFRILDSRKSTFLSVFFPWQGRAGIAPMIRIPEPRREVILKFMEMGATEILLSQTEPVEQAKALVDCAMYAPFGNRGVSLLRAHTCYVKISENARLVYATIRGQ